MIPKTSPALKLLQQVRDEAHRFALEFHRQVRSKRTLSTELTSIPGIGEKRAAHLLTHFGSVANIKKADIETLQEFLGKKSGQDRKSTRLNSSHVAISYAVFCLKKKNRTALALDSDILLYHNA